MDGGAGPLRRITLFEQLRDILIDEIERGTLASGGPLPTEAQLCSRFGVSRVTVRRVIDDLTQRGLVQRERGRASFVRARMGRRDEGSRLVGCALSDLRHPTAAGVLAGIEHALRASGFDTLVMSSGGDPRTEERNLERLAALPLAGAIVRPCTNYANTTGFAALQASGCPLVMVDRFDPLIACDRVELENESMSREVVEHLIALGHRRIAGLRWEARRCSVAAGRQRGYEAALSQAGLALDDELLVAAVQEEAAVERALDRLMGLSAPPTALFGFNERLAVMAIRVLRRRGVDVPTTLAVAAFGDSDGADLQSMPLTGVRWSPAHLGEAAARLLLDRLTDGAAPPRAEQVACRLVVRRSSGVALPTA